MTHNLGDKRKPIINFNQNFSIYIFISQPNKPTNLSPPISSKNYYILLEDVRGCEDGGHLLGICNNFSISSPMKNNQKQNPHHTTINFIPKVPTIKSKTHTTPPSISSTKSKNIIKNKLREDQGR